VGFSGTGGAKHCCVASGGVGAGFTFPLVTGPVTAVTGLTGPAR
jgi:hypothetical protein